MTKTSDEIFPFSSLSPSNPPTIIGVMLQMTKVRGKQSLPRLLLKVLVK